VEVNRDIDWITALNGNLPRTIRVVRCTRAPADFHARFSAKGKIYTYRIWNGPILSPFELGRAWHLAGPLGMELMRHAAQALEGRHDFQAFAASRGKPEKDTTRTISRVAIHKKGPLITLRFQGNGFLYKMVRLMTGALVRTGQGRAPVESIGTYLAGGAGKCSFAAPADGLYLTRVLY
jgi:tRNA pseudouridine38-40 synthase